MLGANKYTKRAIFSTLPFIANVTPFKKSQILFASTKSVDVKSTITLLWANNSLAISSTCAKIFGVKIFGLDDVLVVFFYPF